MVPPREVPFQSVGGEPSARLSCNFRRPLFAGSGTAEKLPALPLTTSAVPPGSAIETSPAESV